MNGWIKSYDTKVCRGRIVCKETRKTYLFNISNTDLDPRYFYDLKGLDVEFESCESLSEEGDRIITTAKNVKIFNAGSLLDS